MPVASVVDSHLAAKCIDLPSEMTLARPPIAGLQDIWPDGIEIRGEKERLTPMRAAGKRGLCAR